MNTRELFEMASLDVLGFLDEREREVFEEAFRAAPPEVQAQVRREQLRFTEIDEVLPEVKAPAGLRSRVLAAVRDAIAAVRTEPIASIGPGRRMAFNSAPLWRAACIGFATASLLLAGFFYYAVQINKDIASQALSNITASQVSRIAKKAGLDVGELLLARNVQNIVFSPAADDAGGHARDTEASLWINADKDEGLLVCDGLRIGTGLYALAVYDREGRLQTVHRFQANSGRIFIKIESIDVKNLGQMQIRSPGSQQRVVLSTGDV